MDKMEDRLNKLREERVAREQARLQKLRELNLKKYPRNESLPNIAKQPSDASKITKATSASQLKNGLEPKNVLLIRNKNVKNNFHVNNTSKRPITAPAVNKPDYAKTKPKVVSHTAKCFAKTANTDNQDQVGVNKPVASTSKLNLEPVTKIPKAKSSCMIIGEKRSTSDVGKVISKDKISPETADNVILPNDQTDNKVLTEITKKPIVNPKIFTQNNPQLRKSLAMTKSSIGFVKPKITVSRKSMLPRLAENTKESVFDRLYKPKFIAKKSANDFDKLKTDPEYLKNIRTSRLTMNKRHTVFDTTRTAAVKVVPRRSISAVHFKRISQSELSNCFHKWSSIGDKLNEVDLEANEDDKIKEDKVVSAIRSERKKVKFMTPVPSNFNTPKPEELQCRLKSWLQKRGKSLDAYHHLQCFGINHLKMDIGTPRRDLPQDVFQTPTSNYDEENKENIALDSDTDDGSYVDTMNEQQDTLCNGDKIDIDNWRRASIDSESLGFVGTPNLNDTTLTSGDTLTNVDELVIGALNDLTSLLREGFDWQQAARWLRSIRERFPHAPRIAAYWECRAALEDSRGDLPASLQCWEEALVKGTERSVAESSLDQLLVKFMHLKISPKSGAPRTPDPKLVNVKNVFKSSIIRFAVKQAKLRRQSEMPVYTVTPVRRSARLSHCPISRTPLRLCDTVQQAAAIAPQHIFQPNNNFVQTP